MASEAMEEAPATAEQMAEDAVSEAVEAAH